MMSIMANSSQITDVKTIADANTAKTTANMMSLAALSPVDIVSLEMKVGDNTAAVGMNAALISSNSDKIELNKAAVETEKATNDMQTTQI